MLRWTLRASVTASPPLPRVSTSARARWMHTAAPSAAAASPAVASTRRHQPQLTHATAHTPVAAAAKRRLSPTTALREFADGNKRSRLIVHRSSLLHTRAQTESAAAAPSAAPPAPAPPAAASASPLPSPPWSVPPVSYDMSTAPISQSDPVLVLTQLEKDIFGHVLACCAQLSPSPEVRVAGGWVRDKLLGLESDDIDLALDIMSGEEFATALGTYMKSIGANVSSMGVIKVNPDQSKHLATATLKVLDVSLDINNFRSEIYEPNSRIPTIERSTAKEDALRRDFTVNALFYNIHTNRVEDYVGGLVDLRAGLLRTPRDPFKTFSDDPLRILRAARFGARFGFRVDDSIASAARQPHIQADLASKVSRERMGIEVHKMLSLYKSAFLALQLLCGQWGLRRIIFEVPEHFERATDGEIGDRITLAPIEARGAATESEAVTQLCLEGMRRAHEEVMQGRYQFNPDEASTLLLAAFLRPYYGYRIELRKSDGGRPANKNEVKKYATLVWHVVRESLRLTQRDATLASDLLIQTHQLIRASFLHEYVRTGAEGAAASAAPSAVADSAAASASASSAPAPLSAADRLQLVTGSLLRLTGSYSVVAMRLGEIILQTLPEGEQLLPSPTTCAFDVALGLPADFTPSNTPPLDRFHAYCEWIAKESKLLQGLELCTALGYPGKGGPHVGQAVNKMLDWQMLHIDLLDSTAHTHAHASAAAAASSSAAPQAGVSAHAVSAASSAGAPPSEEVKRQCFAWVAQYKSTFEVPPTRPAKGAAKK